MKHRILGIFAFGRHSFSTRSCLFIYCTYYVATLFFTPDVTYFNIHKGLSGITVRADFASKNVFLGFCSFKRLNEWSISCSCVYVRKLSRWFCMNRTVLCVLFCVSLAGNAAVCILVCSCIFMLRSK